MSLEKELLKGRLAEAYRDIKDTGVQAGVCSDLAALVSENDLSNKMIARHMLHCILPAIAIYRTLPKFGWTQKDAKGLIRRSVLNAAKPMARFFQTMGRLPFFFALFRIACPASMKTGFGEEGWQFTWKRNDAYAIEWDCHACLYHKVFRRYGVPELTPIFCAFDDAVYGNIPGARWGRTKTIGTGADVCDHSFYNTRKKEK